MKKKTVTVKTLLEKGLIKKSTKVLIVTLEDLKKAGLIKSTKTKKVVLVGSNDLLKRGLVRK